MADLHEFGDEDGAKELSENRRKKKHNLTSKYFRSLTRKEIRKYNKPYMNIKNQLSNSNLPIDSPSTSTATFPFATRTTLAETLSTPRIAVEQTPTQCLNSISIEHSNSNEPSMLVPPVPSPFVETTPVMKLPDLTQNLKHWAVVNHVTHNVFNSLLNILRNVNTIQELNNLPSDCQTLLKTIRPNKIVHSGSGYYYHFGKLPLTQIKELENMEAMLGDDNVRTQLFDMLRHTGGSKERDCVNRCLEKIFSDYLGQYCSWTGKKNNFKLSSLMLMDVIKRAVRQTFPNITDESFERHVMNWFQHAGTRLKRH